MNSSSYLVLKLLYFAISSIIVWVSWRNIDNKRSIMFVVSAITYILYVMPVTWEIVYGDYEYPVSWQGFVISQYDLVSELVAMAIVIITLSVLAYYAKYENTHQKYDANVMRENGNPIVMILLWIVYLGPVLLLLSGLWRIEGLFKYAAIASLDSKSDVYDAWSILFVITTIETFVGSIILALRRRPSRFETLLVLIIMAFYAFINGKRHIIYTSAINIYILFWWKNMLSRRVIIMSGGMLMVGLLAYSTMYQSVYRGANTNYIDMFRYDRLKYVVYVWHTRNHIAILNYPGESYVQKITFMVPRVFWPSKPYPYDRAFTKACYAPDENTVANIPSYAYLSGITTGYLDESIANFGPIFGILFILICMQLFCRISCRTAPDERLVLVLFTLYILRVNPNPVVWYIFIFLVVRKWLKS